ncbi:unnamed protein product [Ixodes pacificus]
MTALERATDLKNENRKNETLMRSNLQMLIKEECRAPGAFKDAISFLKERLELLDTLSEKKVDRYHGALVRARADRMIKGEVPTKRALGTEKRYARRNEIAEIERDGSVTSDKAEIERAFFDHYRALFAEFTPSTSNALKANFFILCQDWMTRLKQF